MSCKTADARGKIKDGAIKPQTGVRTDVRGWFGGGVCAGGGVHVVVIRVWLRGEKRRFAYFTLGAHAGGG